MDLGCQWQDFARSLDLILGEKQEFSRAALEHCVQLADPRASRTSDKIYR
jgi:hypothetical protein